MLRTGHISNKLKLLPTYKLEIGKAIIDKNTGKSMGKIVAASQEYGIGLVQVRLSAVSTDQRPTLYIEGCPEPCLPYFPSWWPSLDISTGKSNFNTGT